MEALIFFTVLIGFAMGMYFTTQIDNWINKK